MSDPPEPLTPLGPADEDAVRRLLADARHTEPLPDDVAARLDGVLAELARESPEGSAVPDLAARRRRRNAGRLLLAAAAVIVAGVGVGQVIGTDTGSDDAGGGGGSTLADEAPDREDAESDSAGDGSAAQAQPAPAELDQLPLQLTSQGLTSELQTQLSRLPAATRSELAEDDAASPKAQFYDAPGFVCAVPPASGDLLPAYLDGRAVVLSLTPAADGTQEATVVDCADGQELITVTVDVT